MLAASQVTPPVTVTSQAAATRYHVISAAGAASVFPQSKDTGTVVIKASTSIANSARKTSQSGGPHIGLWSFTSPARHLKTQVTQKQQKHNQKPPEDKQKRPQKPVSSRTSNIVTQYSSTGPKNTGHFWNAKQQNQHKHHLKCKFQRPELPSGFSQAHSKTPQQQRQQLNRRVQNPLRHEQVINSGYFENRSARLNLISGPSQISFPRGLNNLSVYGNRRSETSDNNIGVIDISTTTSIEEARLPTFAKSSSSLNKPASSFNETNFYKNLQSVYFNYSSLLQNPSSIPSSIDRNLELSKNKAIEFDKKQDLTSFLTSKNRSVKGNGKLQTEIQLVRHTRSLQTPDSISYNNFVSSNSDNTNNPHRHYLRYFVAENYNYNLHFNRFIYNNSYNNSNYSKLGHRYRSHHIVYSRNSLEPETLWRQFYSLYPNEQNLAKKMTYYGPDNYRPPAEYYDRVRDASDPSSELIVFGCFMYVNLASTEPSLRRKLISGDNSY